MRIFLDIGAHAGQTLDEVIKPRYGFDEIHAFEPMQSYYDRLLSEYPSVHVWNYGLSNRGGDATLYGSNDQMEASIYPNKIDVDESIQTNVFMVRASDFFEVYISHGAEVYAKFNCEGAEVRILNDLMDTGQIHKITNMLVDFDIRKVRGLEHMEREVRARLAAFNLTDRLSGWPAGDTHQDRIANWLKEVM